MPDKCLKTALLNQIQVDVCFIHVCILGAYHVLGLPRWLSGKESTCQCRRCGFDPWDGRVPWRRKWQSTPVFLPGKSHGQRSLADYSSWGRKRVRHDLATKQQ